MSTRRLAAILVADVVGYSRLVGADETGTLARLSALRREVVDPTIARHAGRLFKETGDGFLVEFASAVQAVTCAVEIQKAAGPDSLPLRVGIHVGDVVVQGDDLMGDGVNIAARIEGVADAGGIALSRQVHDQVRDRLDLAFEDKGEVELKNLARPVHVFAVAGPRAAASAAPPLALPDKPSIAVLPFQNMSGDPEQEYFADGLVEDIITALSSFKSLFVIARNSSFTYKGKSPDIRQVGRELGVRYVLEGSVRKAGGRLRITGQLIDCETGSHLWGGRFDGQLEDVFDLQDRMTSSVVGAVAPKLDDAEMERAKRKPAENLDAYDTYLRGRASLQGRGWEGVEEALPLFYRAIELDPELAAAYAMATVCYWIRSLKNWGRNDEGEQAEARRLALRAVSIAGDDALVLSAAGHALAGLCREYESGEALIDKALRLNPNLAIGWQRRGLVSLWLGRHEEALGQFERALRLSPLDPLLYVTEGHIGTIRLLQGKYDEASRWLTKALAHQSNWLVGLRNAAIANALAGNGGEARKLVARIFQLFPAASVSEFRRFTIFRRPEDIERLVEGLRLAGLPE